MLISKFSENLPGNAEIKEYIQVLDSKFDN